MIYAVIMAVAFVAFVCLVTVLAVTKSRERRAAASSPANHSGSAVGKRNTRSDEQEYRRELIYHGQRPDMQDFGYSEHNPVCTESPSASEKYLALLRTKEYEPLQWIKDGTYPLSDLHRAGPVNVDVYLLFLHGKEFRRIFICPYGKNSSDAPYGLILDVDGKVSSPYYGSVASEAADKGLTEKQVLAKQALMYENHAKSVKAASIMNEPKKPEASRPAESKAQAAVADSSALPNYLPGFEPDKIKPQLDRFFAVIDEAFPDGVVRQSEWDHAKWDRAAGMLCRFLGYPNGTQFLEAYGYTVVK